MGPPFMGPLSGFPNLFWAPCFILIGAVLWALTLYMVQNGYVYMYKDSRLGLHIEDPWYEL